MPDESDDDGYNGYDEYDRGYYYSDGIYERKVSPMMSPILSLRIVAYLSYRSPEMRRRYRKILFQPPKNFR
jgi:hypothetical protein